MIRIGIGVLAFGAGFWLSKRKLKGLPPQVDLLSELSTDISSSAEQVASVSTEIVNASVEQLDTLNSTISASHEIRSMIERTSESATQLNTHAGNLQELVRSGDRVIQEMVGSSLEINQGMDHFQSEMQKSIDELNQVLSVIKEIANRTQVINEIVFQTKLLSFNASVEAARAGEMGKGFSVVAEEVGKLAKMSGGAADEITEIVSRSIENVKSSIGQTQERIGRLTRETSKRSQNGLENAKHCEKIFQNMGEKINETVEMIHHISNAAREQSQGVSQLDQTILKFQEAADRNRLVSSQATEHSKEFQNQTRGLANLTEWFNSRMGRGTGRPRKNYKRFVWNSKLELQVPSMDQEHLVLVGKINELIDALSQHHRSPDHENVKRRFEALAGFTVEHFRDEEEFMLSVNYPQLASHRRIHQKLLEKVGEFGNALERGALDDMKLISFLRNWLISHIMGVDMQYGAHANSSKHYRQGA